MLKKREVNMIVSYYKSKERELKDGEKNNPYQQRFWWVMYSDNEGIVDRTKSLCEAGRIGEAYVQCWQREKKQNWYDNDKMYVTILKRLEKPVSCIGLQDWIDKYFDDVQKWDTRSWKPSRVEIVYKCVFDENNIHEDPHTPSPLLWSYTNGQIYKKNDDSEDESDDQYCNLYLRIDAMIDEEVKGRRKNVKHFYFLHSKIISLENLLVLFVLCEKLSLHALLCHPGVLATHLRPF
jgi:hypothetical protein